MVLCMSLASSRRSLPLSCALRNYRSCQGQTLHGGWLGSVAVSQSRASRGCHYHQDRIHRMKFTVFNCYRDAHICSALIYDYLYPSDNLGSGVDIYIVGMILHFCPCFFPNIL